MKTKKKKVSTKENSTNVEWQFIALVVVCYIIVLSIYLLLIAAVG